MEVYLSRLLGGCADRIMDVQDKFKELLKALAPFLKGYGYSRRGQNFRTQRGDNWGILFFQKGKWNTKTELEFTVNLGVFSKAIDRFFLDWGKDAPPEWGYDHWRTRIGFVLPGRQDKWWVIDEETDLPDLIQTLQSVLPLAIAEIEKYIKDEDFRDQLLAGGGTGYTKYDSFLRLSVLVSRYGPQDKLDAILAGLRAQGITDSLRQKIEAHISKLQRNRNN
jgi:hypothetical protein